MILVALLLASCKGSQNPQEGLKGHWPLSASTLDIISATALDMSGNENHAFISGSLDFKGKGSDGSKSSAAGFNGYDTWLEIPSEKLSLAGEKEFSISLWVDTDPISGDIPGDILSQFDPVNHKGFNLGIRSNAVTTSQANYRHVHFGIDNNIMSEWSDCGRPGNAVCAFSLAAFNGTLYAGTCEAGKNETGHVYRLNGTNQWIDCGSPDSSNSVMALAEFNGNLYAGTGKYRLAGSSLSESENPHNGGRIFRLEGDCEWKLCGQLPETEAVGGMIVYRGALYASSLYRPAGFFRYDGDKGWTDCGTPDGKRVVALGVYNGYIYATSYDGGYVYRYDGTSWTSCGQLGDNTQTYSFAVYYGRLYVGTWPSGRVYRFEDIDHWTDIGRLGSELEVMGMMVHNGRLIAGTLPLAEVYTYQGDTLWNKIAWLDQTPDVRYRRAWAMAEHNGKVYCSTLPSGKIYSFQAGCNVISPESLPGGWHHIAAIRSEDKLLLYVDGREAGRTDIPDMSAYSLDNSVPLTIGFGSTDFFSGKMADLKVFNRSLRKSEIKSLANPENISVSKK
jgi:hypothetical protein